MDTGMIRAPDYINGNIVWKHRITTSSMFSNL